MQSGAEVATVFGVKGCREKKETFLCFPCAVSDVVQSRIFVRLHLPSSDPIVYHKFIQVSLNVLKGTLFSWMQTENRRHMQSDGSSQLDNNGFLLGFLMFGGQESRWGSRERGGESRWGDSACHYLFVKLTRYGVFLLFLVGNQIQKRTVCVLHWIQCTVEIVHRMKKIIHKQRQLAFVFRMACTDLMKDLGIL